jgi:hypothetical protein
MNSPSSSHQQRQSIIKPRQHDQRDTTAPKYSGSLFAALHDAMLADEQTPTVQRENVTAGVDRVRSIVCTIGMTVADMVCADYVLCVETG